MGGRPGERSPASRSRRAPWAPPAAGDRKRQAGPGEGPSRERRRGARGPSSSTPVTPGRKLSRRLGGRRPGSALEAGTAVTPSRRRAARASPRVPGQARPRARKRDPGSGTPGAGPGRACSELERGTSGHVVRGAFVRAPGAALPIRQAARCAPRPPVTGLLRPQRQGAAGEPTSALAPQHGVRRMGEPRLRGAPAASGPAPLPPPGRAQTARSSPPASRHRLCSTCACLPT